MRSSIIESLEGEELRLLRHFVLDVCRPWVSCCEFVDVGDPRGEIPAMFYRVLHINPTLWVRIFTPELIFFRVERSNSAQSAPECWSGKPTRESLRLDFPSMTATRWSVLRAGFRVTRMRLSRHAIFIKTTFFSLRKRCDARRGRKNVFLSFSRRSLESSDLRSFAGISFTTKSLRLAAGKAIFLVKYVACWVLGIRGISMTQYTRRGAKLKCHRHAVFLRIKFTRLMKNKEKFADLIPHYASTLHSTRRYTTLWNRLGNEKS